MLKQFLHESLGVRFGLDRFVTMNALSDVHSMPETDASGMARKDMSGRHDVGPQVDVTTRLKDAIISEDDGPRDDEEGSVNEAKRYRKALPLDRIEYEERFNETAPDDVKRRVSAMFLASSKEDDWDKKQDLYNRAYETIYRFVDEADAAERAEKNRVSHSFSARRRLQMMTPEEREAELLRDLEDLRQLRDEFDDIAGDGKRADIVPFKRD